MSNDQQPNMTQHMNMHLQDDLAEKTLSPARDCCRDQELDRETRIASDGFSAVPVDHQSTITQYVKSLLEEGHFEKALSLACDCVHDPELGKDPLFLETALILFTNMEKADAMWTEVKKLHSMDQLYPTAKALSQYYVPAALLTAEMLLCKEWCEKTVCLSDLQQITALWVALLWTQSGQDKEAIMAKVMHIGKLIIHEPTFILSLTKAVHTEVGEPSLVLCVNLCLMAIQQPPKDPQSNLVNASRIDTNNAALCYRLSGLLTEDAGLSSLCLMTTFTITPTKKLFTEVDKTYKSNVVKSPSAIPIVPSCLCCVLVHCMYSLLPSTICPMVEWRDLRGKCLKYLHSSSVLNVQVKLPKQEVTMKMYVKKLTEDEEEDKETRVESVEEKGSVEGLSEETDQDQCRRMATDSELQWLSSMMSLDMTWQPHWLVAGNEGYEQETPGPTESQTRCRLDPELGARMVQACQNELPPCNVLCNLEETLQGHSNFSETSRDNHSLYQSKVEESPIALRSSLKEDHAYTLPPSPNKSAFAEGLCTDQDLRSTTGTGQKSISEIIMLSDGEDSCYENKINRPGLESVQQLNSSIPARGSLGNQTMQDYEMQQVPFSPGKQCHKDPITVDENLNNPASEFSCVEGQNNLQFREFSECHVTPAVGNTDSDFLQDFKDDRDIPESALNQAIYGSIAMVDVHPSELPTDIDRWFQSIEQPSEASSINAVDVTPDPVTEQGLQWTAVKSITSRENQTPNEPSWNVLDLWLSEDDNDETSCQEPPISVTVPGAGLPGFANLQSQTTLNLEADPRNEKCSLESTINRLRANLCGLDKHADSTEAQDVDHQSISQQSCHKSSKQQRVKQKSTSQQPFHQQMTDQQSVNQIQTDHQSCSHHLTPGPSAELKPQSTNTLSNNQQPTNHHSSHQEITDQQSVDQNPQSTNHETTNKQPFHHQMTDQTSVNHIQSKQQPSNHHLTLGNVTKLKPHSTNPQFTNRETINQRSSHQLSTNHNFAIIKSTNQQMTNQKSVNQPSIAKQATTSQQSLNEQSTNQQTTNKMSTCENGETAASETTSRQPLNTERNDLISDAEALTSKAASNNSHVHAGSTMEAACCPDNQFRNTKETDSVLHHESMEVPTKDREAQVQEESQTGLLRWLLSAATEKNQRISESLPSKREMSNTTTKETQSESSLTKEDESPTSSELTTEVIRILNAHSGSSLDTEKSSRIQTWKAFTFQDGQLAASDLKQERTKVCECRKVSSCRNRDISGSSMKCKHVQGNSKNGNGEILEPEVHSFEVETKDSYYDSDCSEFEVVQDMSSSWSVSGKRKMAETCSFLPKKERKKEAHLQEKKKRRKSVEVSKIRNPLPAGEKGKGSLDISENKSEHVERISAVNCFALLNKEDTHHQEMRRFSNAEGANEMQDFSLPVKEKRKETTESDEFNSAERTTKVEQTGSLPARRYNLRMVNSVNYAVVGSSTDAELSGETSGEDKGTKRSYCLRSTAPCDAESSGIVQKKPRRASKSPRQTPQMKTQAQSMSLRSRCNHAGKLGDVLQKNGRSVKAGSKHKCPILSASNGVSDHNNNCSIRSSTNSTTADKRTTLSSSLKRMSAKIMNATSPTSFHSSFAAVKNPQLPWEARPPLRTYSTKKNISSVL